VIAATPLGGPVTVISRLPVVNGAVVEQAKAKSTAPAITAVLGNNPVHFGA
jgi:hypothetical protein